MKRQNPPFFRRTRASEERDFHRGRNQLLKAKFEKGETRVNITKEIILFIDSMEQNKEIVPYKSVY